MRFVVVVIVLTGIAVLPNAAAGNNEPQEGRISTGDVDFYHFTTACFIVPTHWMVRVFLMDPSENDLVSVSSVGLTAPAAAVATASDPWVTYVVTSADGCPPPTVVSGILLEEPDAPYEIKFTRVVST